MKETSTCLLILSLLLKTKPIRINYNYQDILSAKENTLDLSQRAEKGIAKDKEYTLYKPKSQYF